VIVDDVLLRIAVGGSTGLMIALLWARERRWFRAARAAAPLRSSIARREDRPAHEQADARDLGADELEVGR
jgi:hypothetical protein